MSQINQAALSSLVTSPVSGAGLAQIFVKLAEAACLAPPGANLSLNIGFDLQPDDKVSPGDLFPIITLTLAPSPQINILDGSDHPNPDATASGPTPDQPVP